MSDPLLTNILLSIATGAVGVGVYLLIGISNKVNGISVKLGIQGVEVEHVKETVKKHDLEITELQKVK